MAAVIREPIHPNTAEPADMYHTAISAPGTARKTESAGIWTGGDRRMVALGDVLPGRLDGRCLWGREVRYPGAGGWLVRVLGGSRAGAKARFG